MVESAAAQADELTRLRGRVAELEALVYVPGVWKCAKCGCVLVSTILNADSGRFSANTEPHQCPNYCGPMWRRTEREAGNELCDRLNAASDKIKAHDARVTELLEANNRDCERRRAAERITAELLTAAKRVMAGLNARIDAAPSDAVPLFDGIAELHDAIGHAEAI